MALTHSDAARDAIANAVRTLIHTNGGVNALPRLVLCHTNAETGSEVATIFFNSPGNASFTAATGGSGVITMDNTPVPEDSNATGDSTAVSFFRIEHAPATGDQDNKAVPGVLVLHGTVGTASPADIILSSTNINPGDAVRINSLTWTAPA